MIDKEIIRNQSGYYDETAGKAILNIEREKKMNNKTGEIWKTQATDGTEYSVVILKDHGAIVSALRLKADTDPNSESQFRKEKSEKQSAKSISRQRTGKEHTA